MNTNLIKQSFTLATTKLLVISAICGLLNLSPLAFATGSNCPALLADTVNAPQTTPAPSVRDEIYAVAQEIRALKPQGDELPKDWKKQAVLKSHGVYKTLLRMKSTLEEAASNPHYSDKAAEIESAQHLLTVIESFTSQFASNGILYPHFVKLSLFYSVQMDMFLSEHIQDPFKSPLVITEFDLNESKLRVLPRSPEEIFTFFESDSFKLSRRFGHLYLVMNLHNAFSNSEPLIFVPTFANLGFESILWLQSRGVGILGLTPTVQYVDGLTMLPATFFVHDFLHSQAYAYSADARTDQDIENATRFFDKLVAKIKETSATKRDRLAKMLMLFFIYHEEMNPMGFKCRSGSVGKLLWKDSGYIYSFHSRNSRRFINIESDLGLAFKDAPLETQEITDALVSIREILLKVCK